MVPGREYEREFHDSCYQNWKPRKIVNRHEGFSLRLSHCLLEADVARLPPGHANETALGRSRD
jgi:hypothetical protein